MSAKKRCFTYCNDCGNGKSKWKIVESTDPDVEWHNIKKEHCVPCEPRNVIEIERQENDREEIFREQNFREQNFHDGCRDRSRDRSRSRSRSRCHEKKKHCHKKKKCHCNKNFEKCCVGDKGDKGDKGEKGEKGNNHVCTLISVKDTTSVLLIPEAPIGLTVPSIVGPSVDLTNWTDIVPDVLDVFDNVSGTYTAPEDGDYVVAVVVNYETSVFLPTDIGLTNVPTIEVYDVDTGNRILGSQLTAASIVIPIPPLSSGEPIIDVPLAFIVNRAVVTIDAVIPLVLGQRIRVRALTNGLVYSSIVALQAITPNPPRIIFDPDGVDTTLTIYKIRNSPIITIDCNN
jgi:hypothetical protein